MGSFQKSLGMFESFCKDEAIVCVEETVWKKRVSVPVQLVKKVMFTANKIGFTQINFAVAHVGDEAPVAATEPPK